MITYSVKVEFIVEVEPNENWDPETCARDYVRHRIDEGYPLLERIKEWEFLSVDQIPNREYDEDF